MGNLSVETRSLPNEPKEHADFARAWRPWTEPRALVVTVREGRMQKPKSRGAKAWPAQSDDAATDDVPDPEELLGGNPEYDASMAQLLLLSAQFEKLLDERQTQKWLQLEDAFLRHFSLVQEAFYLEGRERTRARARKEARALLVELLSSYVETQQALRSQFSRARHTGAPACDGRCIDMANALSRLLR